MYASYHNHTWRCGHASGTEREYIEEAIAGGFTIFGFSDHTPYLYDGPYYPEGQKMHPEQMGDYIETCLALKKEYARDITIHIGLEVEYYPDYFGRLMEFLADYPLDYMILGQHALGNGFPTDPSSFRTTTDPAVLMQYVEQCCEALDTGRFLYFAHPDVLHFEGHPQVYYAHMEKLCRKAKELNIPLEINLQGLIEGRFYPHRAFWEMAAKTGNDVVFGADAHRLGRIYDAPAIRMAEALAKELGLNVLPDLEARL